MQPEPARQRLAPAGKEGATPALATSSIFKYEADKTCTVFVEVTELTRRDGIAAGVTFGPETIPFSKGGESDQLRSHAVTSPKQRYDGLRVPAVYLTLAFPPFLAFLLYRKINDLRAINSGIESESHPLRHKINQPSAFSAQLSLPRTRSDRIACGRS